MFGINRPPTVVVRETSNGPVTTLLCPYCQVMVHPKTMKCVRCARQFTLEKKSPHRGFRDLLRNSGTPEAKGGREREHTAQPAGNPAVGPYEDRPPAQHKPKSQPELRPVCTESGGGDFFDTVFTVLGSKPATPRTAPPPEEGPQPSGRTRR